MSMCIPGVGTCFCSCFLDRFFSGATASASESAYSTIWTLLAADFSASALVIHLASMEAASVRTKISRLWWAKHAIGGSCRHMGQIHQSLFGLTLTCTSVVQLSGKSFDWCRFSYFVRNSLVALLEALCAQTHAATGLKKRNFSYTQNTLN